jgi:uncharacterized phage infection (PIP) family protein YhgE
MKHKGNTQYVAAALALCCAAAFIGSGCRSNPLRHAAPSSLPQAAETTGQAATVVREAANSIGEANAEIQAAVPEVAPQTSQIAAGVDRLRAVEAQLRQMRDSLAAEAKLASGMAKDLAAANARIAQLEDKANGLLNTILIGSSIAGLALAVVSGIWLRSWQGVVTGLGIFAACAAGMWIIQYRAYVAICGLLVAGAYAAWCIITERKASTQIVATVEAIKANTPDFKTIANTIQTSKLTRRIVDRIKGTSKP